MTSIADLPCELFAKQFTELLQAVPPEDRHDVLADLRQIAHGMRQVAVLEQPPK